MAAHKADKGSDITFAGHLLSHYDFTKYEELFDEHTFEAPDILTFEEWAEKHLPKSVDHPNE